MQATSELIVIRYNDYKVVMQGDSVITATPYVTSNATLDGTSGMYATGNGVGYGYGVSELPAMGGRGGIDDPGHGDGTAEFPAITGYQCEGGFWIPTATTSGVAFLPKIGGSAVGTRIRIGTGSAFLPALTSIGGDFVYGTGSTNLPALTGFGIYGLDRLEANMVDYLICGGDISTERVLSVVFISGGVVTDTISYTRLQAVEFLSELTASDAMSVIGTFTQSFISGLTVTSRNAETVITTGGVDRPDLNNEGMVWVVNIDTGASSQYESYGFNSFFVRDGVSYGVAPNGIYKLEGDDDSGIPVEALIEFGRSNFGTSFKKRIPYVYLGIGSDETMYLKVDSDEQTYVYEMRNNSTEVKNHRVDIGKGLHGNYWNFTLLNTGGSDFDMNEIEFEPIISSRKI